MLGWELVFSAILEPFQFRVFLVAALSLVAGFGIPDSLYSLDRWKSSRLSHDALSVLIISGDDVEAKTSARAQCAFAPPWSTAQERIAIPAREGTLHQQQRDLSR